LPGPLESGFITAWAVPTKDGVYVGTGAGIFRLSGDRWERTWPATFAPMALQTLLALSHDELWAIGEKGLWHYRQGAWTSEPIDPLHPEGAVHALTLAPDGTLWAGGTDGIAYRRDGRWIIADPAGANAIAVGRDGTVWAAWGSGEDGTECEVRTLRFDGSAWVSRAIAGCPDFGFFGVSSLAIDATGALLAGAGRGWGGTGGVARFDGRSWETIPEIGGSKIDGATILGTTPDGDVWVAADVANVTTTPSLPGGGRVLAARFDGTNWTTVELPEGVEASDYLDMAPDGALWTHVPTSLAAGVDGGLARLDGDEWTLPFAATPLPWLSLASVAPDGTVFGWIASSIVRLPAPAPGS
jgi:ligand-binding sensor domain-containing protein